MAAQERFYYVATICEDGKYDSFGFTTTRSNNLLSVLPRYKNLVSVYPCATKKYMSWRVEQDRKSFIENGTYMFSPDGFMPN